MRGGLTLAGLAGLAVGHVVQHVLHGATVREGTGPHLPVGLLSTLALVCVEQQDQLLLDQLALLRVSCRDGRGRRHATRTASQGQHGRLLLGLLLELDRGTEGT